jgi:hypothetical protein
MLVVAVQPAQAEAADESGQVNGGEKQRRATCDRRPQQEDERDLSGEIERQARRTPDAGVVGEMTNAPQRVRKPEQPAQIEREERVRSEERPVNEIVRDRVGIPPERQRDDGRGGRRDQHRAVDHGQRRQRNLDARRADDGTRAHVRCGRHRDLSSDKPRAC